MTDWWSTAAVEPQRETHPQAFTPPEGAKTPSPFPAGDKEAAPDSRPSRKKSFALGAAGVALAGAALFAVMPDGGPAEKAASGPQETSRSEYLPPAGDIPGEAVQDQEEAADGDSAVTLYASSSGSGSVGAVVEVTIVNNTETALVVMSSMVKGDGRSAVIGEGTLAPGSRRIEPGETVTGTVEFASEKAPAQVALVDISGNVVAVND